MAPLAAGIAKEEAPHGGHAGLLRFLIRGTVMAGDAHHLVGIRIPAYGKMTALYQDAGRIGQL